MSNNTRRVLYVYQGTYPWEVRVKKFCEALESQGYEVTVLSRWAPGLAEFERYGRTAIVRVGANQAAWKSLPFSFNPLWRNAIRKQVQALSPQLVIAREMLIAEACADAARGQCPVIMDMAEHYPAAMRSWKKYRDSPIGRVLVHWLNTPELVESRAVRSMDAVITVCEENEERIKRLFSLKDQHLCIVRNTPPLHAFDHVRRGASQPARVFSYQGYITRERGVVRLVQAFDALGDSDTELLIAGDGESFDDVKRECTGRRSESRIKLLGAFSHDQLDDILSRTDVGVIAFDEDEFRQHTIPNKLFDYLLCAKPVIVSNCAPMARIVNQNGCGIVINNDTPDQLREAMKAMREKDLTDMSLRGLEAARAHYHWELDSERLVSFLSTLL